MLTLAAITILSIDFPICYLNGSLLLLMYYHFWQTKSEFSINRAECALVFIDAESFWVIAAILFMVVYGLLIAYPYM